MRSYSDCVCVKVSVRVRVSVRLLLGVNSLMGLVSEVVVGVVQVPGLVIRVIRVVCGVGRGGMFGEECLHSRFSVVSDVQFWRSWARAVAPASPMPLSGRCAVVVVEDIFLCAVVTVWQG